MNYEKRKQDLIHEIEILLETLDPMDIKIQELINELIYINEKIKNQK
jgi:hypothetical protein